MLSCEPTPCPRCRGTIHFHVETNRDGVVVVVGRWPVTISDSIHVQETGRHPRNRYAQENLDADLASCWLVRTRLGDARVPKGNRNRPRNRPARGTATL